MDDERLKELGFHLLTPERGSSFFDVHNDTTWVKDLFKPNVTLLYDTNGGKIRAYDNHEHRWMLAGQVTEDEFQNIMGENLHPVIDRLMQLVDEGKVAQL